MSTRVRGLRALSDRLRDPLWLPLASALCALLAWQAAHAATGRTVLVADRDLPAGTVLSERLVHSVRWSGPLPGSALLQAHGTLRAPVAAGLPLLRSTVEARGRPAARDLRQQVAIPSGALLSAPPLSQGQSVDVYLAASGLPVQLLVSGAVVAAASTTTQPVLSVAPADLRALLDGIAAGRLILVEHAVQGR